MAQSQHVIIQSFQLWGLCTVTDAIGKQKQPHTCIPALEMPFRGLSDILHVWRVLLALCRSKLGLAMSNVLDGLLVSFQNIIICSTCMSAISLAVKKKLRSTGYMTRHVIRKKDLRQCCIRKLRCVVQLHISTSPVSNTWLQLTSLRMHEKYKIMHYFI